MLLKFLSVSKNTSSSIPIIKTLKKLDPNTFATVRVGAFLIIIALKLVISSGKLVIIETKTIPIKKEDILNAAEKLSAYFDK